MGTHTPAQKLWTAVFGCRDAPDLQEDKVRAIVGSLPDERERLVVLLRYGFEGGHYTMRQIGRLIPRANGSTGVSRPMATRLLRRGVRRLQQSARRQAWKDAERP